MADENGISFFETSARTGYNINLVFQTIAEQMVHVATKKEELRVKDQIISDAPQAKMSIS